jgi:hypothetical protein
MLGSSSGCFFVKARARVVGMGKKREIYVVCSVVSLGVVRA